jgi:hypothetical protein
MGKNNIISGDDFKSTKSIERKKKKKISDDEDQDNIDTLRDNELIPLTEDNIESYFGNENYVQKLGDVENEKKLTNNEGIKYQIDPNNKIRLFCFKIVKCEYHRNIKNKNKKKVVKKKFFTF